MPISKIRKKRCSIPELPECETVVRTIRPLVWGCDIIGFSCNDASNPPKVLAKQVEGQSITHITRVGKYIVFKLTKGYLISHLRMAGQWHFSKRDPVASKHFRWGLTIRDHEQKASGFLWFKDPRKFGTFVWVPSLNDYPQLSELGPDGLDISDPKTIYSVISKCRNTSRPIKNVLLDQSVIAGSGNIYCSESLFAAKIDPRTPASELSDEKIADLCVKLCEIFNRAIDMGGSSISDYSGGRYHEVLQVYGREDQPCYECNDTIERIKQAGRSTFFCPSCQGDEENEWF